MLAMPPWRNMYLIAADVLSLALYVHVASHCLCAYL